MERICIFVDSGFFSEGEETDAILSIFNKVIDTIYHNLFVYLYVLKHVWRGSKDLEDNSLVTCF